MKNSIHFRYLFHLVFKNNIFHDISFLFLSRNDENQWKCAWQPISKNAGCICKGRYDSVPYCAPSPEDPGIVEVMSYVASSLEFHIVPLFSQ